MKNYNCKDMELISLNMAGWAWKATKENWEDRLERMCKHIRNKMNNSFVIALQEVQLTGSKYLPLLEEYFPDYYIILPQAYRNQPRSVISVLLINKNLCESYNIRTLNGLEDSCRYNFVHVNTYVGLTFRILNVSIPHNCLDNAAEWYRAERKRMRSLYISNIKELANTYRLETDLKFILLGDLNTLPDDVFVQSLAYSYDRPMLDAIKNNERDIATWQNPITKASSRLDYILYSNGMLIDTGVTAKVTRVDDSTITQVMSDHAMLFGGVVFDCLQRGNSYIDWK